MNNKKQDWRTADSNTKPTGRDHSQRETSTANDKPIAGKKPIGSETSSKKAGASRQNDNQSSRDSSRR